MPDFGDSEPEHLSERVRLCSCPYGAVFCARRSNSGEVVRAKELLVESTVPVVGMREQAGFLASREGVEDYVPSVEKWANSDLIRHGFVTPPLDRSQSYRTTSAAGALGPVARHRHGVPRGRGGSLPIRFLGVGHPDRRNTRSRNDPRLQPEQAGEVFSRHDTRCPSRHNDFRWVG